MIPKLNQNARRRSRGGWYWVTINGKVILRGPGRELPFIGRVHNVYQGKIFKAPKGTWWVWQGPMNRHGAKGSAPTLREAMRALLAVAKINA